MKTMFQVKTAVVLTAGLLGISSPAIATDTREAIKLCDANPNCTILGNNGESVVQMMVKGKEGTKIVECPMVDGKCTVNITAQPSQKEGSKRKAQNGVVQSVVGAGAGLHADQARRKLGDERQ